MNPGINKRINLLGANSRCCSQGTGNHNTVHAGLIIIIVIGGGCINVFGFVIAGFGLNDILVVGQGTGLVLVGNIGIGKHLGVAIVRVENGTFVDNGIGSKVSFVKILFQEALKSAYKTVDKLVQPSQSSRLPWHW